LPLSLELLEDRIALSLVPQMVADINTSILSSNPSQLVAIGSTTYFSADDGVHGLELWKSDGTAAGTAMVKDIYPGGGNSYPSSLTNVNGKLFFRANDSSVASAKLWQSDGTPGGTVVVTNLSVGPLTKVKGTLYFSSNDGSHGQELWALVDSPTQSPTLSVSSFPATITAGAAGSFTLTAKNADGSTNTAYRNIVHFTSSDPQAVLPADYTFTAADLGVHTFSTAKQAPVGPAPPGARSVVGFSEAMVPNGVLSLLSYRLVSARSDSGRPTRTDRDDRHGPRMR
jgi:ELWxxDGT repeat protein